MKNLVLVLAVAVLVVVGIALAFGGIYNRLVGAEEGVKGAWAQVENVYQRRADLIPNLVETVKGYAAHERATLENVTNARARVAGMKVTPEIINDPEMMAKFQAAQGELSSALSRLLVTVENYPDLKASQNFLALQTQLEGTENRIAVERMRYNDTARQFNTMRRVFPNILVANIMGFREKAYYEAEKGAEKAPVVKF